jgi:signal transduction histidine kinase
VSVRAKILLAIAPLVGAIALLGLLSVLTASSLGRSSEDMLRQNYQSVHAAQAMREALDRVDGEASLALAGRVPRGHALDSDRARFADALLLQESSVFESEEGAPTRVLRERWVLHQELLDTLAAAPDAATAARLYAERVKPSHEAIKRTLDEILSVNQRAMYDKSTRARATARLTNGIVVATAILALATALPFALVVVYRVLRRLKILTAAVQRLGDPGFEARVALPGGDEIGELAVRFNEMASRLEEYSSTSVGKLLEAQKTSQAAIDSIPDPTIVFGASGALVAVNRAAGALLALDAAAPGGEALLVLEPVVGAAITRARDHVLRGGGAYEPRGFDEAVGVDTGEGKRFFLARGTPVDGAQRTVGATVILQDVTRLHRFDELRNELVATVAHELRTPLTSLRMAILLCLEQESSAGGSSRTSLLATAQQDCERLQATVDELLDLARIQSGEVELRKRPIEVRALLDAAVGEAAALARERDVRLCAEPPPAEASVAADGERLQRVFSNLMLNAIRHAPPGSEVALRARPEDGCVRFVVEDQGPGIAPEHAPYVFDRFYRVPGSAPGGVGLGLSIAREIVAAHGGTIGVDGQGGAGCRFWFTVPAAAS